MFRAIKQYDGSDSAKCITLTAGDTLSAVHALDETWFIGFNERTKEIGAFPIDCVETIGNEYGPMPAKDEEGQKMDEKAIYANVSKQIQARIKSEADVRNDDDPRERSRTLSTHARSFDMNKMMTTKPEKTFRLTLVKNDNEDKEPETNAAEEKHLSMVKPEAVFSLPQLSIDSEDDKMTPKVRFADVALEHSISVADSTFSWEDSFEMSYEGAQYARPEDVIGKKSDKGKEKAKQKKEDGKYHKLKRSSLQASTDQLANKRPVTHFLILLMFVVISVVLTLGIIYLMLVFSFGYTFIESGVIVGVSALLLGLCCLFSFCRCAMLIILPNLITDRGRIIWMCVITGLLLSYPIHNISHNMRETSQSLTCLTNLVEKQSKTLDRQLAQPFKDIVAYVDHQSTELKSVSHNIELALGNVEAHLQNFYGSLEKIDDFLIDVVGECKQPFVNAVNYCATECTSQPTNIKSQCLQACSFMYKVSLKCDDIQDARKAEVINATAASARSAIDGVNNYFNVDVAATEIIDPASNSSQTSTQTSNETSNTIEMDVDSRAKDFEMFIRIIQILLSFCIFLMMLRPFVYIRNYLTVDAFDNIYISKDVQDKQAESDNDMSVLPLKQRETNSYIDTDSNKPTFDDINKRKEGIFIVVLHLAFSTVILLFDFALYHILMQVREYGDVDIAHEDEERLQLNVTGNGQVAEFYRVMLQAVNLHKSFTMSLNISACLPNPEPPKVGVMATVFVLYILLLLIVVFGSSLSRIRRRIVAYYYPAREVVRQEYLRKQIEFDRNMFNKSLSQKIKSFHKEKIAKTNITFSSPLARCLFFIPMYKYYHKLRSIRCSGCQMKESKSARILTQCTGGHKSIPCEAVYCVDCKNELGENCPICSKESIYNT